MLDVPSLVRVEGLTLATAENQAVAMRLPRAVNCALRDPRAEVKSLGSLGQTVTVPFVEDPTVRLETGLWDSKIEERSFSVTKLRLAVYDSDGGAEFETTTRSISELNLSADAVLLYILGFYAAQYSC